MLFHTSIGKILKTNACSGRKESMWGIAKMSGQPHGY